jgi:superoxide reductase
MVADEDRADPICCGKNMKLLVANATDGGDEKHVPVIEQKGAQVTVRVGATPHHMSDEHHIEWICLTTNKGAMVEELSLDAEPVAVFTLKDPSAGDFVAYEYCSLHGLWQSQKS